MVNRVSNEQVEALLDFLSEHPALAKGVGLGARSKETVDKLWNGLALKLNSYRSGSSKSGERWKKYWADLKHKSKVRLARWRQDTSGTGDGPSSQDDLSDIDKKVMAIIGKQGVLGDVQHRVLVFNTQPATPDSHSIVLEEAPEEVIIEAERPRIDPLIAEAERPKIDPEWVMELERSRVESEQKLANAALIMAESARMQAETSRVQAESSRVQADSFRVLAEMVRDQNDSMHAHTSAILNLVRELCARQPISSAQLPHTHS